jgi:drug/metabolite transporter (DMT)-like permease
MLAVLWRAWRRPSHADRAVATIRPVTAILWALGASLGWGSADFLAGMQARKSPVAVVVIVSQAIGLTGITILVALRGVGPPSGEQLTASVLVGVIGLAGAAAFYRALAIGAMSVVAPIGATSAAVPVVVGLFQGDRPTALQWVGIVSAIAGCVLAAGEGEAQRHAANWKLSVGLALFTTLAIGAQLVFIDIGARHDPLWTILISRAVVVALFACVAVITRPPLRDADVRGLAVVGVLDVAANACFAIATTTGLLGIVAVIGSTFPVFTVALAHRHLHERLGRAQRAGVVLALAGVVLISAQI